jgi:ankyrin repeat protein
MELDDNNNNQQSLFRQQCSRGIFNIEEAINATTIQLSNVDQRNRGVIWYSAWKNAPIQFIKTCLERGADSNQPDNVGVTPLMAAAACSNIELVLLLLEYGINVHAVDTDGWNALHWGAANNASLEVCYLLIQAGIDYDARDNKGLSAAIVANRRGNYKIGKNLDAMKNNAVKVAKFLA